MRDVIAVTARCADAQEARSAQTPAHHVDARSKAAPGGARGSNKEKAALIRKLAKDRFRAVTTYGMDRNFARLLTDEEILALPPPKPFPWLED